MKMEERYQIIDESHGEGGFGEIAKFKDNILDRTVAIKTLHYSGDDKAKERFRREAKTLARMSHPNIPAIYDVKFSEDDMSIHFEFIEGRTLREIIQERPIPSTEDVREWFIQVGSALDHAHDLGIIHRDIKPENIIISKDYKTSTLVDFGIALTPEDVDRLTSDGYVIGTPGYMSPEQTAGEPLDKRSDLYSLGITLYETLSGHLPTAADYQSLSDNNEAIPPSFDKLILECLVTNPTLRISSANKFTDDLTKTLRTDIPLSELLTDARLHEIVGALQQLSSDDFSSKPKGQRLLVITRLRDLVRSEKDELIRPTAEFVKLLIRLANHEPQDHYSFIADTGFEWGFDKYYSENWRGDQPIRNALINSSKIAGDGNHSILSNAFLKLIEGKDMESLESWAIHDLRKIVIALLANPNCGQESEKLAEIYDRINEVSH
jgi:serine/threonine protein kinase